MKKLKTIKKHIEKRVVVDKIICDICKKDIRHNCDSCYESHEVEIQAKLGSTYPEGDFREYYMLDCCDVCFVEKIKPLIEENLKVKFRKMNDDDYRKKLEYT